MNQRTMNPHAPQTRPFHTVFLLLFLAIAQAAFVQAQCNTAPTAVDDSAETPDNAVLLIDVLANDADANGDVLAVSVISETCPGDVTTDFAGLLVYTPTPIAPGTEQSCSITYRITDAAGATDNAVVSVTVMTVPAAIFLDGFENGTASAWTATE
jgi:hypothetical protein